MYASAFDVARCIYTSCETPKQQRWRFEGANNAWVRGTLLKRGEREWAEGAMDPGTMWATDTRSWFVQFESNTDPEHNNQPVKMSARKLRSKTPEGGVLTDEVPGFLAANIYATHGHFQQPLVWHQRYDSMMTGEGRPHRIKLPCAVCAGRATYYCIKCSIASDFVPICFDDGRCFDVHASTHEGKPPPRVGGHTGRHATRSFWSPHNARCIEREKRLPCSVCNKAGCSRYCHLCSDADHFVVICDKCARAAASAEDGSEACSVAPARTKRQRDDDGEQPAASADSNPYARVYNESKRARRAV